MNRESPPSSSYDPVLLLKQLRAADGRGGASSTSPIGTNSRPNSGLSSGFDSTNGPSSAPSRGGSRASNASVNTTRSPVSYESPDTSNNMSHFYNPTLAKQEVTSKWNTVNGNDSGMISLLQRQVAEKVAENTLDEANRTIALLIEENKALEHALALHSHAPLPPSFPQPTHPSELALLRDRVAYLESALESALESTSGELGPDWNLGDLDLESTPPHSLQNTSYSTPPSDSHFYSQPAHHSYPPQNHTNAKSHPVNTNSNVSTSNTGRHSSTGGKELDKRPPFISAVSSHSSRFVKPVGDTAKLQIPKAPPDSKPVIRIDLSSELSKTQPQQPPRVKKKQSIYSSKTLPVSVSPVTIANFPNN